MGTAPSEAQINLLKAVRDSEGHTQNQFFNTLVADDCVNLGLITPKGEGAFTLTDSGRRLLADFG